MAQSSTKKKPYLSAIIFGVISIACYVALLTNQKVVTEYFTMGGWYTILPIGAAFFFSFVHGAFASNVISVLGLEARKKH